MHLIRWEGCITNGSIGTNIVDTQPICKSIDKEKASNVPKNASKSSGLKFRVVSELRFMIKTIWFQYHIIPCRYGFGKFLNIKYIN